MVTLKRSARGGFFSPTSKEDKRDTAFRKIRRKIKGNNHGKREISMPVLKFKEEEK